MPKAYIAVDWSPFPDPPYGGQAVCSIDGDMKVLVKQFFPPFLTKEVRDARNAENYCRTAEWIRSQRVGG